MSRSPVSELPLYVQKQLPNILTILRLVLAAIFFLVLNQYRYEGPEADPQTLILVTAFILFIIAALTDLLDGHLARKWHVESSFGRVMDPTCDKLLILGALIYLAGPRFIIPPLDQDQASGVSMISGFYPWMVVVILARELLVTAIRSEIESKGASFGANIFGKLKMVLQSVTIPTVIAIVWIDPHTSAWEWTAYVRDVLVYATIGATILSGLPYVTAAKQALLSHSADSK